MRRTRLGTSAVLSVVAATATVSVQARSIPETDASGLDRLLAMVPEAVIDDANVTDVYYVDMTLVWDRLGVGLDAERLAALGQLRTVETFSLVPQLFDRRSPDFEAARAETGFTMFEIDRELAVLRAPRHVYIDETSVARETVSVALEGDPVWGPELREVATRHGSYVTWGDDPLAFNYDRISPFRPFGQAGQLAVVGDTAVTTVRTFDPADVEAVLATMDGEVEPATTGSVLAPVVAALSGEDVVQLVAVPRPVTLSPQFATAEVVEQLLEDAVLLDPYQAIAVAELADGDGFRTEILLVHADGRQAAANADHVTAALADGIDVATGKPLSEILPDAQVSVDGAVVRVMLDEPGTFYMSFDMLEEAALFPIA